MIFWGRFQPGLFCGSAVFATSVKALLLIPLASRRCNCTKKLTKESSRRKHQLELFHIRRKTELGSVDLWTHHHPDSQSHSFRQSVSSGLQTLYQFSFSQLQSVLTRKKKIVKRSSQSCCSVLQSIMKTSWKTSTENHAGESAQLITALSYSQTSKHTVKLESALLRCPVCR